MIVIGADTHKSTHALAAVDAGDPGEGYRILCPEHVPGGALDPPRPLEVSKLGSIHLGKCNSVLRGAL
jgi:hypothetical protein